MKLTYFKSGKEFREWLDANHKSVDELWIAFYKKASGKKGISYSEAVEEALCFGWIDGIKKRVDEFAFTHRFTPRKPKSNWSRINVERVQKLMKEGRMMDAGAAAFKARDPKLTAIYSFENRPRQLDAACQAKFESNEAAWKFFSEQPPGYRRLMTWWIMEAKRDETRARRLERLIRDSEKQVRVA